MKLRSTERRDGKTKTWSKYSRTRSQFLAKLLISNVRNWGPKLSLLFSKRYRFTKTRQSQPSSWSRKSRNWGHRSQNMNSLGTPTTKSFCLSSRNSKKPKKPRLSWMLKSETSRPKSQRWVKALVRLVNCLKSCRVGKTEEKSWRDWCRRQRGRFRD